MNVAELKLKIFREVDLPDTSKLEEFYGLMLNFINSKKEVDEWVGLSENEILGIKAAINELDSGKGIPQSQVLSKFKNKYTRV